MRHLSFSDVPRTLQKAGGETERAMVNLKDQIKKRIARFTSPSYLQPESEKHYYHYAIALKLSFSSILDD